MNSINAYPARCGLAVLSGATYAMAYPPLGWRWLVIPGLAGLLVALRGQSGTRARAIGFLHGMTAYGLGLSWLIQVFGGVAVALWCVLAAFTALFAEMQSRASLRGVSGWNFAIFTTLNWCGWEFIRAELFPLKFPWMTAGLAIGPNALLPWIGVYGAGTLVVLAATLLVMRKWKSAATGLGVLVLTVVLLPRCPEPSANDAHAVKVAGVQLENVSLTEYLAGTKQLPPGIQHVVWPEYSVPYDLLANKRDLNLVQNLCRERGITLTLGTQSRPIEGDVWRNIALTLDPTGIRGQHTKVHTVHFFDDGIPGTTALPVLTNHGKVGTPICFDCDYEGVVRGMTAAGAEFFVAPTMDAEKWTARQHDQHAELFRIRACENGRWMFVVATSGVSQLIDPNGHIHARLAPLQQGTISGTLRRETRLTFYTRFGWLVPWCVLAVAAAYWIILLWPSRQRKPA
ncbi:MAG: nitrilase-related carbon-nitrogen hydrolase [Verrucomicrobiota bacterium]